jgi:hypothetical protein
MGPASFVVALRDYSKRRRDQSATNAPISTGRIAAKSQATAASMSNPVPTPPKVEEMLTIARVIPAIIHNIIGSFLRRLSQERRARPDHSRLPRPTRCGSPPR